MPKKIVQLFILAFSGFIFCLFFLFFTTSAIAVAKFFAGFFLVILVICFFVFCLDPNHRFKLFFCHPFFVGPSTRYLRRKSASWINNHKGMVCCYASKHGLIHDMQLTKENKLALHLKLLESDRWKVYFNSLLLPLGDLPQGGVNFDAAVRKQFKLLSLELIDDISVEHRAIRSAVGWINELHWSRDALKTLTQMDADLKATLQMAPGNKLLESSIPAMEDAQKRAQSEYMEVKKVMNEATSVLRQLVEFLSVPSSVRRVLSFDRLYVYDAERHEALRQSFDDVVSLNYTYRDLC